MPAESAARRVQATPIGAGARASERHGRRAAALRAASCELRETISPGVWWVTLYHDREDLPDAAIEVVFATEVIEIGYVPAIVGSTAKDVDLSLPRLRAIPQDRRPPALAGCGERRA